MSLRCIVVDDHRFLLQLLAPMLSVMPGVPLDVVATATTVADGLDACETHVPDLLILDVSLPDGSGLRVARKLIAINPRARVIILTGQASTFVCPAWLNRNIHAVVNKTQAFNSLQRAIASLAGAQAGSAPLGDTTAKPRRKIRSLTKREQQIFALVGGGVSSKDIATRLGLSPHTVSAHRKKIAEKLGVTGSALSRRAFHFAQQMGSPVEENG